MSSRMRFAGPGAALLWAAALALSLGCGPRTDRLAVSGKVTLDGAPLDRGSIRFSSVGDAQALATGAMIRDGRYAIPRTKGLLPGAYRVRISSPDMDAPPVMAPATPSGPSFPVPPDRIPPEYNVDSEQTIEVASDGDNHFVFDIASQGAK